MLYDATGTPLEGEPEPVRYFPLGPFGTADIMGHEPGRAYGVRPIGSPLGGAYEFDGEDDYVDVGDWDLGTKDWTFTAWVKTGQDTFDQHPLSDGNNGQYLRIRDGDLYPFIEDSDGERIALNTKVNVADDKWHFVAFTVDYDDIGKAYVDGALEGSEDSPLTGSLNSYSMSIGRQGKDDEEYFNGSIDEVQIYDRALSPTQIRWLYHHPTGLRQPSSDLSLYAAALRRYGWHQSQVGGLMRYVA